MKLTAKQLLSSSAYGVVKTKSLKVAESFSVAGKMTTSVLLGENGTYIVAPTNKLESILVAAGYERA